MAFKQKYNPLSGGFDLVSESSIEEVAIVKIDEGAGVGFIIKDQDRTDYSPIGEHSLDLSVGDASLIPRGTTGVVNFVNGYNLKGDGYAQLLMGYDNIGNGNYCLINGISNNTSGGGCVVVGTALDNTGGDVMAIFGQANTLPAGNPYGFQIGNGTITTTGPRVVNPLVRSDSFRVYKNGVVEAPSSSNALINTVGDKALTTKEYVDKFYQFFQGTGTEYVGQTTIPLMNQQAGIFEKYIEKSFSITQSDNYLITLSFISSLNATGNDFIAYLDIITNGGTETLRIQAEPKDSAGTGVLVDVLQGGVIQPQINTGTNQRLASTFTFNKQLLSGTVFTFALRFGCDVANRRATIYQAQIMIERKTLLL